MIYAVSALAVVSSALALIRPSLWALFAAGALNLAAAIAVLTAYLSR